MGSVAINRPSGKQAVRVPSEVRAASEEEDGRKRRTLGRRDGMKRPLADSVTSVTRKTRSSDVALLLLLDFGRIRLVLTILLCLCGEGNADFTCCFDLRPFLEGVESVGDNGDELEAEVRVRQYSVRLGRRGIVSTVVVCVTVTDRLPPILLLLQDALVAVLQP